MLLNQDTPKIGTGYVAALREQFGMAILDESWQAADQVTITVDLNYLPDIVEAVYYGHGGWLSVVAGNDERPLNGHFALYYVLSVEGNPAQTDIETEKCYLVIRSLLHLTNQNFQLFHPVFQLLSGMNGKCEICSVCSLSECQMNEGSYYRMTGQTTCFHYAKTRWITVFAHSQPQKTRITILSRWKVKASSRYLWVHYISLLMSLAIFGCLWTANILSMRITGLFYVHRGMEKLAETRMSYEQVTFLADRICGICGYAHNVAYANSIERALEINIPDAHYIRTILLEVERLHSHLLNLGLACHFVGFDTGFMQFFRVREKSMQMAELLTGTRKTYGMNLIGGVRRDILKDQRTKTLKWCAEIRQEVSDLIAILLETPYIVQRTQDVGRLEPDVTRNYSPVGPTLRGSVCA